MKKPLTIRNMRLMPVPGRVVCLVPHCDDCGVEMLRVQRTNVTIGQVYQCPHCKEEFVTLEEYPIFQLIRESE